MSMTDGAGLLPAVASKRSSLESVSFDLNSDQALDIFGARSSLSGVRIDAETALRHSPWWRGVNLIARDVGKLPCRVYKWNGGSKEKDKRHQAYSLIRWKPNPYQHAMTFRAQITGHAVSRGNGYAWIERSGSGKPKCLWPLDPRRTYPIRDLLTGRIWYILETHIGPMLKLDPSEIIHVKGLSFDGLIGYSVIDLARDSVGLGLAERKYCEVFFKNAVRPSVVLEAPGIVTESQVLQLRESFERMYSSVENMHRTLILTNGLKANPITFSAKDAEINDMRKFDIGEIANWLNLPRHKLGDTETTPNNTLEQMDQNYLSEGLDFWLCAHEYEYRDKLLTEAEKNDDQHVIEFERQRAVSVSLQAKAAYDRIATGGRPWKTPDEVRAELGLPALGGDAAELLTPNNFGQGGILNDPLIDGDGTGKELGGGDMSGDPATDGTSPDKARMIEAITRATSVDERRAHKRLAVHALKAAANSAGFLAFLDTIEADHGPSVREIIAPSAGVAHEAGIGEKPEKVADGLVKAAREALLTISGQVSAVELVAAVQNWAKEQGVKL